MAAIHAFDLLSGEPFGPLDAGNVRWSERLNADLELSFRIDLGHRPSRELVPKLLPGRTKLVLHDPPIVKSFWLPPGPGAVRYTDRRFLELRCSGLWSWFQQFPIRRRFRFNNVDQHTIAATLIGYAQDAAQGGGIGVQVNAPPSGVLRDRTYEAFELAPVGQRIDELAAVIGGFDFTVDSTFDGNVTVADTWRPHHPRVGAKWPESTIQIDADGTTSALDVAWSAPATNIVAAGAGEGVDMLVATATASLDGYPPLWIDTGAEYKSVERQATLNGHAARDLQLHNRRAEAWSATVLDRHDLLKGLTVGDEAQIVIGPGDFRWPDGLEVVRRVVGRTVTVSDDGGPDEVQLDLEVSDV